MNDSIEACRRVRIAIAQLGITIEKTLVRLYEQDGNPWAGFILHKIYYARSFKYRVVYHYHLFVCKAQRWLRMTRYA